MRRFLIGLPAIFLACQARDRPGQILEFPRLPALSSDPTGPREGGWSGLSRDPLDPTGRTFLAVNDRGLNVPLEAPDKDGKGFPFPAYHQKLLKLRLDSARLQFVALDSLATRESPERFTVGLPSTRFPTGEIAWDYDLRKEQRGTAPLPPSPDGYDFEGLRLTRTHGYLCEEYGPSFVEFDRPSRRITRQWSPGSGLPEVLATRRPNHGFEGIAITPSGKLMGILQSPLWNWVGKRKDTRDTRIVRMVELDMRTGMVREFALLPEAHRKGNKVKMGDLVAIDDTRFLTIEHNQEKDGTISADLVLLDISHATDITSPGTHGVLFAKGKKTLEELMDAEGLAKESVTPVQKSMVRENFVRRTNWTVDKPEGLEVLNDSTVILLNDNDFGREGAQSSLLILPIPSLHRWTSRP